MADLKNKYQAIINDLDKIISDKNELETVKSKVNELTMMFMDVIDRLTFLTVERIDKLEQEQKNIEDRINKVQNSVTGIESDIYDEDDESEDESYEFETVGGKTVTKKKGGITRAVVGGVVAGPIGALVGSGTAKAETQTVGGIRMTKVNFNTYTGKLQRMSGKYPMGFTDFLDRCISEASADPTATGQVSSVADEILKFKDLLDKGVITPEEFAAKKSQLLGL